MRSDGLVARRNLSPCGDDTRTEDMPKRKTTPAMAGGLTDHVWSVEELRGRTHSIRINVHRVRVAYGNSCAPTLQVQTTMGIEKPGECRAKRQHDFLDEM